MAYTLPSGSIVECSVRYTVAGQTCLNIGHYRVEYTGSAIDGATALDAFFLEWDATANGVSKKLSQVVVTDVKINEIVLQAIFNQRWARRVYTPSQLEGTVNENVAAPNQAIVITTRTEAAGRKGHGGIHVSGFAGTTFNGAVMNAATVGLVDDYGDAFYRVITVGADYVYRPIIYSKLDPALSKEITSHSTSDEPRTMRRRGLRLGI